MNARKAEAALMAGDAKAWGLALRRARDGLAAKRVTDRAHGVGGEHGVDDAADVVRLEDFGGGEGVAHGGSGWGLGCMVSAGGESVPD